MQRLFAFKIIRFSLVGVLGFMVDAGFLQLFVSLFKLDLYISQVIAFLIAASVTWYFNRRFTFKDEAQTDKKRQWGLYLLLNTAGGAINYGVYALCIANFLLMHHIPILALAAGTLAGLVFNFFASKYIVFRTRSLTTLTGE